MPPSADFKTKWRRSLPSSEVGFPLAAAWLTEGDLAGGFPLAQTAELLPGNFGGKPLALPKRWFKDGGR